MRSNPVIAVVVLGGVAALLLAGGWLLTRPATQGIGGRLTVADVLGGAAGGGHARADGPRDFRFPDDHGPHPDFRNEWWYFTGNLESESGERFGFQLTAFRTALSPDALHGRSSAWATRQLYMVHFALTDVERSRFIAAERFERAALGLAGARARPFAVWLHDWRAETARGATDTFPVRLRASHEADTDAVAVDLLVEPLKPVVLQGDEGLSRKGPEAGNASYHYSLTRLRARGTVLADGRRHPVDGLAWLDREWSSGALEAGPVGWDWFALQLADGRDLMYYRLRRADGSTAPYSGGVLVGADGEAVPLGADDVEVSIDATWTSPLDGTAYPARWHLRVPDAALELDVRPVLAGQELDLAFRYWEGAVDVRGDAAGSQVDGRGYVELTGYAEARRTSQAASGSASDSSSASGS